MYLTKQDVLWWENHDMNEIMAKYKISSSTVNRAKRKYGVIIRRRPGSGSKTPTTKEIKPCLACNTPHKNDMYCSRKCMCGSEEHRKKLASIDRSYMQTEKYRSTLRKPDTLGYKRFVNRVHKLSNKTYIEHKDELNPNNHPRTRAGTNGGYQLDHIVTVRDGFDKGLSAEVLSEKNNLRMIPWKENLKRNRRVSPL